MSFRYALFLGWNKKLKDGPQEAASAVWSCQEEEGFQEER
jgi:hypothetical protein